MHVRARLLWSAAAAVLLSSVTQPAGAVAPDRRRAARPEIDSTSALTLKAPLRQTIDVEHVVPSVRQRAWDDFVAATGGKWTASWDRATGVPSRLWGGSAHVPGVNGSPALAEMVARGFLRQHADLLAPGVAVDDLVLAANHDDGRIRTVGFWQHHAGMRVVGGQISVRFLNDRLYVVSSQILPDVSVAGTPRVAAIGDVGESVRAATVRDLALPRARATAAAEPVILPLVADDVVLGYRVAVPVDVDAGRDGRWLVYADPSSGEPLVRVNQLRRAEGTLVYDVPVRYPAGGRTDLPAGQVDVIIDGAGTTTTAGGGLTWNREQAVPLVTSVVGTLVEVHHTGDLDALEATRTLQISPAGQARWSEAGTSELDAQLSTFVHTGVVKAYIRPFVTDPRTLEFIDDRIVATVNLDDECNAYYTGGTINFFASSDQCENTGRLPDVVYHEFGHGLHDYSIIPGVGLFDGAMSEGASDFLSAIITGDPGMGRGFFYTDEALRHLDDPADERIWPDDVGEIHQTGIIFGGAFWDLRKAAILLLGETEGVALANRLFLATLQRSTDIPSSLIEALAADDDDGDLSNGTPHECLIRQAFGEHGLRSVGAIVDSPGSVVEPEPTSFDITVGLTGVSANCLGDEVIQVEVEWEPRGDSDSPTEGASNLTTTLPDTYVGSVPLPDPGDIVQYHVNVIFSDGTATEFPDNRGDRELELYRGELITLYCHDFETNPFEEGWTTTLESGLADPWEWGPALGLGGDPPEAFDGQNVVGMVLGGSGVYEPGMDASLLTPVIDVDQYSDVRLHYRRWLGVEDGFYDQATIYANEEIAWRNYDSTDASAASVHTRDKQWVFRDLSLSTRIYDGTVQLRFALESDGDVGGSSALEFGGWTLDDLCIVADPNAICGDGELNGVEQCDLGEENADLPDQCRTNCRVARCGDAILDSFEECDDGNDNETDGCNDGCRVPRDESGCCSSNDDPTRPIVPVAIVGLALLAMRRRRKA